MIYVASKIKHAQMWRQLRTDGIPIVSTWIDMPVISNPTRLQQLWEVCVHEASTAICTIAILQSGEIPKGMLIEIGAALASDKYVFAVGLDEYTFSYHPKFVKCHSLGQAIDLALVCIE